MQQDSGELDWLTVCLLNKSIIQHSFHFLFPPTFCLFTAWVDYVQKFDWHYPNIWVFINLPIHSLHLIENADKAFGGGRKDEITHFFSKSSIFFFWLRSEARPVSRLPALPGIPFYPSHFFFSPLLSPPPLAVVWMPLAAAGGPTRTAGSGKPLVKQAHFSCTLVYQLVKQAH